VRTYFKDDADGAEYIYSELGPSNAHISFPCFDQPDLKAADDMLVLAPVDWIVVSIRSNKPITNPKDESEEGKKANESAVFCRKSLLEYVELIKENWLRITKNGIHYYEKMLNTPYPFGKFDQVFCPDYNMGAKGAVKIIFSGKNVEEETAKYDEAFTNTRITMFTM